MKKLIFILIISCLHFNIFSKALIVDCPESDKTGGNQHIIHCEIHTDTLGRITAINTNGKLQGTVTVKYEGDKIILTKSYEDAEGPHTRKKNITNKIKRYMKDEVLNIEDAEYADFYVYKNSILYYMYSRPDNLHWRFEYVAKNGIYEATFNYYWENGWYQQYPGTYKIFFNIADLYNADADINGNNCDTKLAQVCIPFLFQTEPLVYSFNKYDATSYLKEGSIHYMPSNLASIDGLPWVSSNGYGIDDIITIHADMRNDLAFAFYNGFQHGEKEYLYTQNSRAQKISIRHIATGKVSEYVLKDTPEKQIVELPNVEGEVGMYEIKILEVYPGTKYKDLCIQAIVPHFIDYAEINLVP